MEKVASVYFHGGELACIDMYTWVRLHCDRPQAPRVIYDHPLLNDLMKTAPSPFPPPPLPLPHEPEMQAPSLSPSPTSPGRAS